MGWGAAVYNRLVIRHSGGSFEYSNTSAFEILKAIYSYTSSNAIDCEGLSVIILKRCALNVVACFTFQQKHTWRPFSKTNYNPSVV